MTEAFKRGYMDKMAELRKLAEEEDAGIGSAFDNAQDYHPGANTYEEMYPATDPKSYGAQLRRVSDDYPLISTPWFGVNEYDRDDPYTLLAPQSGSPIPQSKLQAIREAQARVNASRLFTEDSAPWKAIYENLLMAGGHNQNAYKETGKVPVRDKADVRAIPTKLLNSMDKKQLEALRLFQNAQAATGSGYTSAATA